MTTRDELRAKAVKAMADALYITPKEATAAFDAQHGIVRVEPMERIPRYAQDLQLIDLTNGPKK